MAVILNYCFTYESAVQTNLYSELMRKPSTDLLEFQMHENEFNEEISETAKTIQTGLEETKTTRRRLRSRARKRSSSSSSSESSDSSYSSSSKSTYTDRSSAHSSSSSSTNSNSKSHTTKVKKKIPPALPPVVETNPTSSPTSEKSDVARPTTPPPPSPVEVPMDPRVWTADHIAGWVKWMTKQFKIEPEPDVTRFPTTGAELCTLSRAEFWVCAGSRQGGILFAKHFALTLHSATGRESSPMLNDNEPSKY